MTTSIIQAAVFLLAFIFVFVNLVVDVMYAWLDRGSAMPEPGAPNEWAEVVARMRAAPIADAWGACCATNPRSWRSVLVAIAMMAVFSPWIAPFDPAQHFFGKLDVRH